MNLLVHITAFIKNNTLRTQSVLDFLLVYNCLYWNLLYFDKTFGINCVVPLWIAAFFLTEELGQVVYVITD